jgi:hypothetical protein
MLRNLVAAVRLAALRVPRSTSALVTAGTAANAGSCPHRHLNARRIANDHWTMMQAMLLRLAYLAVTNALSMLRLLPMGDLWGAKTIACSLSRGKWCPSLLVGYENPRTVVEQGKVVTFTAVPGA